MIVPSGYFDAARRALRKTEKSAMNAAQIKHMVDRFLGWRLPENFAPDAGISFKPTFNDHLTPPSRHDPSGTNLFDCNQAEAMVRYMLEGLPASTAPASPPESVGEEATEERAGNPYSDHYRAKETAILAGAKTQAQPYGDLADRLRSYAYYRQENAKTGADALLVMDLLDAATAITRPRSLLQEDAKR